MVEFDGIFRWKDMPRLLSQSKEALAVAHSRLNWTDSEQVPEKCGR